LIVYFGITFPSLIALSVCSVRELSHLLTLMQSIDLESRNGASSYLGPEKTDNLNDEFNDSLPHSWILNLSELICSVIIFLLVTMIFIVILCIQANNQNVLMYSYSG
jgi:hypothetical protein